MKLVAAADVTSSIGFDTGVQSDVFDAAVEAATANLKAMLRTELDRAAVVDTFYILPTGSLPTGSVYRTRLALSRGFVTGAVTVGYASTLDDLSISPVALGGSACLLDAEKGGIVITGPDLRNTFLTVSYMAGFDTDPGDADLYTGVPTWLTDIARLAAIQYVDGSFPDIRFVKGEGAAASAKALMGQMAARLASKIRYFPSATHPLG
jgi:hypothetical protein